MLRSAALRAARTPTCIERDQFSPGAIDPAADDGSEELIAYEAGCRRRPTRDSMLSVSFFYDDLRAYSRSPTPGRLAVVDADLAWQIVDGLEFLLAGFNLLDASHSEMAPAVGRREIPRSVYIGARVSF